MKRCLRVVMILLVVMGLAACSLPAQEAATPPPTVDVSPTSSPLSSITPYTPPYDTSPDHSFRSQAPFPTYAPPVNFVTDMDVPDILKSTNETVVNSNYTLYEDKKYIYYLDLGDNWEGILYIIDKGTKNVNRITGKYCGCFTVDNGIVYYTELNETNLEGFDGFYNVIKSYDPSANIKKTVINLKYNVYSIAAYNNKLYFSYNTKLDYDSDLFVMNTDGTGMEEIRGDVWTLCIYKDTIYYAGSDYPDGAPLVKCNLDGSGVEGIGDSGGEYFDISDNRLFYDYGYLDLGSGEPKDTAYDTIDPSISYGGFAPFGHYLIYNYGHNFYSYDFKSGDKFNLTQAEDIDADSYYEIHTTKDNYYISVPKDEGIFDLYRLVIKGGKASVETVVSCKTLPAKVKAPDTAPAPAPTAVPLPSLSPSSFVPDTDIPDIFSSTVETAANSNFTLYEAGDYIYYLGYSYQSDIEESIHALYRIDKATGGVIKITDKDCSCFTVCNGIVYYTESNGSDEGYYNIIKSYDPITDKKTTIKTLDYDIYGMAAYDSKLYLSCYADTGDSYFYIMNTDGAGEETFTEGLCTFCIYKDAIYYGSDAGFFECDLNGTDIEAIEFCMVSGYFDMYDDWLFYEGGRDDINSGVSVDMKYNEFALYGNYLVCDNYAEDEDTCYFYLYDLKTGRTYYLTKADGIDSSLDNMLCAAKDNVYFSTAGDDGSFVLYRLSISGGRARFEKTAEFAGGTNQ